MKKKVIIGRVSIVILTSTIILLAIPKKNESNLISKSETESILSYTIDDKPSSEKPSKGSGYLVNKIKCEKGTNIIWDNTNWEVEILNVESDDRCTVDFTKDVSKSGLRVTVVPSIEGSIDSVSKATVSGGKVVFYPSEGYEFTSVTGTGCTLEDSKLVVSNVTGNITCNLTVKAPMPALKDTILANYTIQDGDRPNLSSGVYTDTNTKTLYQTTKTENGQPSYYFAGNAQDNWVYFGGFYWRIIRINEDGSIRLLYHGISTTATNVYIASNTAYNSNYNHPKYVGYMYGNSGNTLANSRTNDTNSPIKNTIDSWYTTNMTNKNDASGTSYDKYISRTAVYCNDRSVSSGTYNGTSGTPYFGARGRLVNAKVPSYKCGHNTSTGLYEGTQAVEDKFTGSTTTGNGKLGDKPIALMTADEIHFAGGYWNTNAATWYYNNSSNDSSVGSNYWWTMSPSNFNGSNSGVFVVDGSNDPGYLGISNVNNTSSRVVRPVVSLKSCVLFSDETRDGTASKPYVVEINDACANSLN